MSLRRAEKPDLASVLQHLLAAGRGERFVDEAAVLEQVEPVRGRIDRDHRSRPRRIRRQPFDLLVVTAELPPMALRLRRRRNSEAQTDDEESSADQFRNWIQSHPPLEKSTSN